MGRMRKIGLWVIAALTASMVVTSTASATSYGIMAWGSNSWGELGTGNYTKHTEPHPLLEPTEVTAVSAGEDFSLALLANGTVKSWGYNGWGNLGNGSTKESDRPVAVHGLSEVSAISAGGGFSLALLKDGHVMAWGFNGRGELGIGTTENKLEPVEVPGLEEVTAVSAGNEGQFGLALLRDGHVMAWGTNGWDELGIGSYSGPEECGDIACSKKPVEVSGLEHVVAVSAGGEFGLALLENGHVMAWGANTFGEVGNGTSEYQGTPVEVHGLEHVKAVSAGGEFGLALLETGMVKAWGDNYFSGELGDGSHEGESLEPVTVTGLSEVEAISAGTEHSLALLKNGTMKAWGLN